MFMSRGLGCQSLSCFTFLHLWPTLSSHFSLSIVLLTSLYLSSAFSPTMFFCIRSLYLPNYFSSFQLLFFSHSRFLRLLRHSVRFYPSVRSFHQSNLHVEPCAGHTMKPAQGSSPIIFLVHQHLLLIRPSVLYLLRFNLFLFLFPLFSPFFPSAKYFLPSVTFFFLPVISSPFSFHRRIFSFHLSFSSIFRPSVDARLIQSQSGPTASAIPKNRFRYLDGRILQAPRESFADARRLRGVTVRL